VIKRVIEGFFKRDNGTLNEFKNDNNMKDEIILIENDRNILEDEGI
jgi:hypothetical protein